VLGPDASEVRCSSVRDLVGHRTTR